jgi:dihydrofolate reductase
MEAIIAVDMFGGISKNNVIPWNSKKDIRFFYNKTVNNVIIMGKTTFISLPKTNKPLKNRLNVVITNTPHLYTNTPYLIHTNNTDIFLDIISNKDKYTQLYPYLNKNFALFVIGGKQIYEKYMLNCSIYWITYVKQDYECDLTFNLEIFNKHFNKDTLVYEDNDIKIEKYIKN